MKFLRFLEGLRFPAMDSFMSLVTNIGSEVFFMVVALILLWCVNKRQGYSVLLVGLFATVIVQMLKLLCRVPRPWVIDPAFTIVEAARADAGGFSFPSGHAQNITGTLGAVFALRKEKWLRVLCVVLIALISFSRMYLGVHTPLDVFAGMAIGIAMVLILCPFCKDDAAFEKSHNWLFAAGILLSLLFLAFISFYPFPADVDEENLSHGVKSAYTLFGCVAGMAVVWPADWKTDFQVEAPLPGQILKVALGLAVIVGIKSGLKAVFTAVGFTAPISHAIRYFCIFLFGGVLWPLTFPAFAKVGRKTD